MPARRTIAVVTGSRAELGLLTPVLRAIENEPGLRLRTVVAGAHLTSGTWRDLPAAGFVVDSRVPMQRRGRTGRDADVAALARGVAGFGRALARIKPDVVLVLGDRIEVLAAACAAAVGGWQLAHVHGGDRAEGVADESMRHAVSKMAHLHFPATALSRRRLIRMGELPERVFLTGSPAVDGLSDVEPAHAELLQRFGLPGDRPYLIVLQHPIGAAGPRERRWMAQTLAAIASFPRLVLAPNADPGSDGVLAAIRAVRVRAASHLPRPVFLRLLKSAGAIVGNSSAGLIEAAVLRTPAANVGPRQAGRERAGNVIDSDYGRAPVLAAVRRALRLDRSRLRHPYGDGPAGRRIAQVLASIDLASVSLRKHNAY